MKDNRVLLKPIIIAQLINSVLFMLTLKIQARLIKYFMLLLGFMTDFLNNVALDLRSAIYAKTILIEGLAVGTVLIFRKRYNSSNSK